MDMEMRMPKPLASRKLQSLSSLDNNSRYQRHASLHEYENTPKGNQPGNLKNRQSLFLDDGLQKENRPPSGFPQPLQRTPSYPEYRHTGYPVNQTIDHHNNRKTTPGRHPSTGGKTISSSLMKKIGQPSRGSGDNGTNDDRKSVSHVNCSNTHYRHIKQKQRTEQRMSPEHLKLLSRRIDPSLPASPQGSPAKPILPSIFSNRADDIDRPNSSHQQHPSRRIHSVMSSSLYQTSIDLWPSEPTLGDLASDNIKNLTNLLKVRLSQAKYRVLAQLEEDDHKDADPTLLSAVHILSDDIDYSTWPSFEKHTIELPSKRTCGSPSVSGNGARLFCQPNVYLQSRRLQQKKQRHIEDFGLSSSPLVASTSDRTTSINHGHHHHQSHHSEARGTAVSLPPPSPSTHVKSCLKRKRRFKSKVGEKPLRNDGRDQASKMSPVNLEDGSVVFVCIPCDKKYKTRNGLAYHLDRCTHQPVNEIPFDERTIKNSQRQNSTSSIQSSGSKSSGVHCICDHPTDDAEMMVKCDECQLWLHMDCIGTSDGVLDDVYHCPRCISAELPPTKRPRSSTPDTEQQQQQQQTIASLIFQQLNSVTTPTTTTTAINHHLLPPLLDNTTRKSSSLPIQQSLWGNLDPLDSNAVPSSSLAAAAATSSSATPSLTNVKNEDNANIWGLSTVDIPSLLYSDATSGLPSSLDDDYLHNVMDLPSSELSLNDLPPTEWFQFANFDDDFHCDDSQTTPQ